MVARRAFLILSGILSSALFQTASGQSPAANVTVIEGMTLIDGVAETAVEDAVMVIENATIKSVGRRGSVKIPAGAQRISAAGKTIMPGIVNLHGHVGRTEGMEWDAELYNRERIQRDVNAYLYYGITHIISLGYDREPMIGFRTDQRAGKVGGSRIYSAGYGFAARNGWRAEDPYMHRPTTVDEARAMVRKEAEKNLDFMKVWVDDAGGTLPKLAPEIYGAVIEESHKYKKRVFAHTSVLEDAKELMRRGIDVLAHSVRNSLVDDEFLSLARRHSVTQIPNLSGIAAITYADHPELVEDRGLALFFPATVLDTVRSRAYHDKLASSPGMARTREGNTTAMKNVMKIAQAGIPIGLGTDSGTPDRFPGLWEHREMEMLVEAGLTPMQVIRIATINGARFLGADKTFGTLTPGKVADFLVLDGNPLIDMSSSRKIDAVWMNGKRVDRPGLARRPS